MNTQQLTIPPALIEGLAALITQAVAVEVAKRLPRKTLFSIDEACERLNGISYSTLNRYERDGLIERCPNGSGVWYSAEEIELCEFRIAGKAAKVAVPRKPRKDRAKLKETVAAA